MSRRRMIEKPLGLDQDTYFRLRMDELKPNGWKSLGYHNQPFATRDAAEFAAQELRRRIRRNSPRSSIAVAVVEVRGS